MNPVREMTWTCVTRAGRSPEAEYQRQFQLIRSSPLLLATMDALPDVVLILNEQRQIVGANSALYELLRLLPEEVVGSRPGELFGCCNVDGAPDGCGTAKGCMTSAPAASAVLESQQSGQQVTRECRLRFEDPVGALDLKVCASSLDLDGEQFTVCVLRDISDEKRLAFLSHLFFHDIVNTVGTIQGFTHLLRARAAQESSKELGQLALLADQLADEIRAQRDLMYAESGDLSAEFEPVNSRDLLEHLRLSYGKHPVGRDREIKFGRVWNGNFVTDHRLLGRVLGNMLKNALEASEPGDIVTVSCLEDGTDLVISVHNAAVMPEEVQLQVFQRSFSTKATPGRGIGTHSMKLLGERYLGGRVTFTSREGEGTTFSITLPKLAVERISPRAAK